MLGTIRRVRDQLQRDSPLPGPPDPVASVLAGVPQVNHHRFLPQPAVAVVPGTAGLWLPGTACEVGIGAFMNESSSEVNGPRSEDEHGPPFEH